MAITIYKNIFPQIKNVKKKINNRQLKYFLMRDRKVQQTFVESVEISWGERQFPPSSQFILMNIRMVE